MCRNPTHLREVKGLKEKRWNTVDILFWVGCFLIAAGLGLRCGLPVGMVVGGVACLAGSYLSETGGQKRDKGGDGS